MKTLTNKLKEFEISERTKLKIYSVVYNRIKKRDIPQIVYYIPAINIKKVSVNLTYRFIRRYEDRLQ